MAEVSRWIQAALSEAKKGQEEGGLPIGSVLIDPETNRIVSTGHNLRVQTGDPTAHAEMVCIKKAGRRRDWHKLVLVSTLRLVYRLCQGKTKWKDPLMLSNRIFLEIFHCF